MSQTIDTTERRIATLMGVVVADAAALALHWLYDGELLGEIAQKGDYVFLEPDAELFKNAAGAYSGFYHPGKSSGDLSHYGNYAKIALASLAATGEPDPADFRDRFAAHFGPGGAYVGYIDHATKGTLSNIAAAGDTPPLVSGIDDDQIPGLGAIAAIAVADSTPSTLSARVEPMVRVTSDNDLTVNAAQVSAHVIASLINGSDMTQALEAGAAVANATLAPLLAEAMDVPADQLDEAAPKFGRACPVANSVPLSFAILKNAANYADGVRANTRAGGDNCGRALLVGAALGAHFGLTPPDGIPRDWITQVTGSQMIHDEAARLSSSKAA
jgi:ADP-ribosylglycohydrolase